MSIVVDSIIKDMGEWCFRVNAPSVVYEQFDNELVAIHMGTGVYHSMVGVATDAFVLLSKEATAAELAEALATRYAATSSEILTALAPFLEELQKEQLIVRVETPKPREPLRVAGDESGLPFVPPSLEAFKDLEGLLLLDPIHEVDDEGWPPPSQPAAT
ncbi:MAG: PqqD family peptide modification chaperone [Acidobacteriia bacterium]|nr:PqqD family peptide modification chaperone [Terriglobia bacterium]